MTTLRITVEWLDGRYHGREWPPAPYRLYQAMIAGDTRSARADPVLEAAMRHLETLAPPVITAPPVDARTETTAAVPNNDADVALALHARGAPALARGQTARALTRRTRRARHVEGAVDLRLACNAPDGRTPPRRSRASPVASPRSGSASTSRCARVSLHAQSPAPSRRGYATPPHPPLGAILRVPWPGAFDALEKAYRDNRARIGAAAVAGAGEAPVRTVAYACELEPPPVRWAAFALRTPDDRPLALEGTRAVEVAAMVRHAIGRAARSAGLDAGTGHRAHGPRRRAPHPHRAPAHRGAATRRRMDSTR